MRVITPFIWHLGGKVCSFRDGANSFSAVIFTLFTDWLSETIPNECENTELLKDLVNNKGKQNQFSYVYQKFEPLCVCVCVLSLLSRISVIILFT